MFLFSFIHSLNLETSKLLRGLSIAIQSKKRGHLDSLMQEIDRL